MKDGLAKDQHSVWMAPLFRTEQRKRAQTPVVGRMQKRAVS